MHEALNYCNRGVDEVITTVEVSPLGKDGVKVIRQMLRGRDRPTVAGWWLHECHNGHVIISQLDAETVEKYKGFRPCSSGGKWFGPLNKKEQV